MTPIEQAAVNYIAARDAKKEARARRNAMRCQYAERAVPHEGNDGIPPCRNSDLEPQDYCDSCKVRDVLHAQIKPLSKTVASAFAKLRRLSRNCHDNPRSMPLRNPLLMVVSVYQQSHSPGLGREILRMEDQSEVRSIRQIYERARALDETQETRT